MSGGSRFFDEAASGYDRGCRSLVPDLDGFYGAVVEGLLFGRGEDLRVLDLGAGTGLLSLVVAEEFPGAKITLTDFSAEMLSLARQRFAGDSGRFEFRLVDYAREPLPGRPEGYDLVVSALSIHHLTHDEKWETFKKVHDALTDGGWFVNADQVLTDSPESRREHHEHRPRPETEHHEGTPPTKAVEKATLQTQMAWLREAGFEDVRCRYRNDGFAVYGGRKRVEKGNGR